MPNDTRDRGAFTDIFGAERSGKNDFAYTLAQVHGPTKLLTMDYNYLGPLRRHRALGSKISVDTFFYSCPVPPPTSPKEPDFLKKANAVASAVRPAYKAFKEAVSTTVRDPRYPSIIIDNGSILHRMCRLALWGYVHKVPTHLYAQRTNDMSWIYNELRYSGKHVIMIYREKAEYTKGETKSEPTGDTVRDAWDGGAYDSMLTLHADRDDNGKFFVEVVDSTLSADHVGRRFSGEKRTYERIENRLLKEQV